MGAIIKNVFFSKIIAVFDFILNVIWLLLVLNLMLATCKLVHKNLKWQLLIFVICHFFILLWRKKNSKFYLRLFVINTLVYIIFPCFPGAWTMCDLRESGHKYHSGWLKALVVSLLRRGDVTLAALVKNKKRSPNNKLVVWVT